MTDKLDKIIAQLRKLDSIETTLNEMCDRVAKIEGEIKILKSNTNVMDEKLKETDQSQRNGHRFKGTVSRYF